MEKIHLGLIEQATKVLELGVLVPFNIKYNDVVFAIDDFDNLISTDGENEQGGFQFKNQHLVIICLDGCEL